MADLTPTSDERIAKKLRGFRAMPRGFAIKDRQEVPDGAFRFFNLLVDLSDYGVSCSTKGRVNYSAAELSELYNCNRTTIYRNYKNVLLKAGLVRFEKGRFWVLNPNWFDVPALQFQRLAPIAEMQKGIAKSHKKVAKPQHTDNKESRNPSSIYKGHIKGVSKKENWKDYLIDREAAKEPCFCRSGKSLEDCCGPSVHEGLGNSEEMRVVHYLDKE